MMRVEVFVDLEPVDDGHKVAWWATAPAVGNLAVAADSLRELEDLARSAIDEILESQGRGEVADVRLTLRSDGPRSAGIENAGVQLEVPSQPKPTVSATDGADGLRVARELVAA